MNKLKNLLIWTFGGARVDETDAQFARRVMLSGIALLLAIVLGTVLIYAGLVMGLAL